MGMARGTLLLLNDSHDGQPALGSTCNDGQARVLANGVQGKSMFQPAAI